MTEQYAIMLVIIIVDQVCSCSKAMCEVIIGLTMYMTILCLRVLVYCGC